MALAAIFALANILPASVTAATKQAVKTDAGGRQYAVQILDQRRALPVLSQRADLLPVIDSTGQISTTEAASPADLRIVSDPAAALGLLVEGRHPVEPGEATISSFLERTLGLHVGDESVVSNRDGEKHSLRVSGITSSPADASDLTIVLVSNEANVSQATIFLTNTNPFADAELSSLLDERVLKGRTVATLAEDEGSAARTAVLSLLSYATSALGATSISLILALLAILAQKVRRDAFALQASGMGPVRSWRIIGYAGALAILAGTISGIVLTLAAAALWKSHLSAMFGQDWRVIAASWASLLLFTAGLPALMLFVVHAAPTYLLGKRRRILPRINMSVRAATWTMIMIMMVWAAVLVLTMVRLLPVQAGGIAGAPAVIIAPVLLARLVAWGAGPAERRVVQVVAQALLPVVAAAALLTWLTTSNSAAASHNAISMRDTSATVQPPGSLLLTEVPSSSGEALRDEYRRLGGKRVVVYRLPDESGSMVRAANAGIIACMRRANVTNLNQVDPSCIPFDSAAPVNIVALSSNASVRTVVADPSLIERGLVGLITFTPKGDGEILRIEEMPAGEDAMLGGNMPGAVLPADGPLARSLDLRAADGEFIAFLDFADLSAVSQAQFRSDVARLAGAAQVTEERTQHERVSIYLALSRAWSVAGAFLLAVLLGFGGAAIISTHARLRRTLIDMGSVRLRRRLLTARIFALPAVAGLFAAGLGLCSAWLQGVHDGTGFGWVWAMPGLAALAVAVALGAAFYRMPPRTVT